MTLSVVLADANILFSRTLRDYFLYAADAGAIELHWSQEILDEMSRNLRARIGLDIADTDRLEQLMNAYLEFALVEVSDEAANEAAQVEMDEHGIVLIGSEDLIVHLAESMPGKIRSAHEMTLRHSKKDHEDLLATLARCAGPSAAVAVRRALAGD